MKKKLLFLFIVVGVLVCLCSCGEKYTITFDANGTEMATEQVVVEKNEFYSLPIPHKVGYGFLGWYNGDEKIENIGTWEIESDLHLVAKWEFLEFEITCDVDSDGKYDSILTYNSNSDTFTINAPEEEGKIFSHWIDQNGNTYSTEIVINTGSEGNLQLTAVWWDFVDNNILYEYNGSTLSVIGYNGNFTANVNIPSALYGKKVVGIKKGAFENAEKITSKLGYVARINIPQSIEYIEENAFNNCKNVRVMLSVNNTKYDYLEVTEKWLEKVEISEVGNVQLIDVLLLKRPTIGASIYVHINQTE